MYVLDTNAIIYYLGGDARAMPTIHNVFAEHVPVYVSAITEVELFSFNRLTAEDERLLELLIKTLSVIPVDSQIARLAAVTRRSSRLPLPDSIIAATALFTGSTLLTRNVRDFRKIPSLSLRAV